MKPERKKKNEEENANKPVLCAPRVWSGRTLSE